MAYDWRTEWPGVFARHADDCPVRSGRRCTCGPLGYRASARDPETGRRVLSPQFETVTEARGWLSDQSVAIEAARGMARDDDGLGAVIDEFIAAAESGLARDRDGLEYGPGRVRELRELLGYVDAQLGTMSIQDVRRRHVQALVDQLYAAGYDVDRLAAVVDALRALYVYAIQREAVDFSPVVQLTMPDQAAPQHLQAATQPLPAPAFREAAPAHATTVLPDDGLNGFHPASQPPTTGLTAAVPTNALTAAAPPPAPTQDSALANQYYQALTPERVLWWSVLLIVLVAVLIAIVLAAESV